MALREQVGYLIHFMSMYVVKLEDANISFAAINTGMSGKIDAYHLIASSWLFGRPVATPASIPFNCFDTMAVSTTYLTFGDLSFNSRPVKAPCKKIGYAA